MKRSAMTRNSKQRREQQPAGGPWTRRLAALLVGLLAGLACSAFAEQINLSTYHASPRGYYDELRTTNNAYLAVAAGTVGIGTNAPDATRKLHVVGATTIAGVMAAIQIQGGNPQPGRMLTAVNGTGLATWTVVPNACVYAAP